MRRIAYLLCFVGLMAGTVTAQAAPALAVPPVAASCPGHPNAIGTSRVLVVDPTEHARLGIMQYPETLPLEDHEVVLTFDDGPLPPYSNHVLDILASECVKATYFLIGRMAREFPKIVERIYNEGHTIGTHSQNHPLTFNKMPIERVQAEVDDGIASVSAALGNPKALAPFFRVPGLMRAPKVEAYLASKSLMTFSSDFVADDWKHIKADQIVARALTRIEARGRGILLLHDIHPATVLALPTLLHELKARGYRIVQVVPTGADRPKTVTAPDLWVAHHPKEGWPRTVEAAKPAKPVPAAAKGEIIDLPRVARPKAVIAQPVRAASAPATKTTPATDQAPAATASVPARHAKGQKPPRPLQLKPAVDAPVVQQPAADPAEGQPSAANMPASPDSQTADAAKPSFLSSLLSRLSLR